MVAASVGRLSGLVSSIISHCVSPKDTDADARTLFVGNLPTSIKKAQILKLFSPFGKITNARFRGAVSNDPKQSKKVAAITQNIHNKLDSM